MNSPVSIICSFNVVEPRSQATGHIPDTTATTKMWWMWALPGKTTASTNCQKHAVRTKTRTSAMFTERLNFRDISLMEFTRRYSCRWRSSFYSLELFYYFSCSFLSWGLHFYADTIRKTWCTLVENCSVMF